MIEEAPCQRDAGSFSICWRKFRLGKEIRGSTQLQK